MDEADRWHGHASESSQYSIAATEFSSFSTSTRDDRGLIIRIRSLSVPLKYNDCVSSTLLTPKISDFNSKENASSTARPSSASCQQAVDLPIAKLAQAKTGRQVMGVTKFGGPAGQIEDTSVGSFRRRPRRSDIDINGFSRASSTESLRAAGINHKTLGPLMGAERRTSVSPIPTATSREKRRNSSSATRKPRFTVHTVTPAKPNVNTAPCPVVRHVPGSFRSEISVIATDEPINNTSARKETDTQPNGNDSDPEPSAVPTHLEIQGRKAEEGNPVETLTRSPSRSLHSIHSQSTLSKQGKPGTGVVIGSKKTKRPIHNPFFKPYSSHVLAGQAQPPLKETEGQSNSTFHGPASGPEAQSTVEEKGSKMALHTRGNSGDHVSHPSSGATHDEDNVNLPSTSTHVQAPLEPGQIPSSPEKQDEAVEANDSFDLEFLMTHTPSVYSRKTSLGYGLAEQIGLASKFDDQKSKSENDPKAQPQKTAQISRSADEESPLVVHRRSGLKSPVDLKSGRTQPSPAWTKHEMIDFINEATRLRRSLSVSSSSNKTGSTGESSDMARLIPAQPAGKHSYRFANTVASSPETQTPPSRHHWVHNLLGRQHSPPSREAHLTQRPSTIENGGLGTRQDAMPSYCQLDVDDSSNGLIGSETTDISDMVRHSGRTDPEVFSKIILDLESLMREVLQMAKHVAVEKEAEHAGPADDGELVSSGHVASNEGVWATSDGNGSFSGDRGDFVESAIAAEERSNAQKARDQRPYHISVNMQASHSSTSPNLEQEFQSVSAHARELAHQLGLSDPLLEAPSKTQQQRDERRESILVGKSLIIPRGLMSPSVIDFAKKSRRGSTYPETIELPEIPRKPPLSQQATKEQRSFLLRGHSPLVEDSLQNAISRGNAPQLQTRSSSVALRPPLLAEDREQFHDIELGRKSSSSSSALSFAGESTFRRHMTGQSAPHQLPGPIGPGKLPAQDTITTLRSPTRSNRPQEDDSSLYGSHQPRPNLSKMHHFSIRGPPGAFSLRHAHRRAPIARDWSNGRKRFVAAVTCLNTALLGIIIGIYAGEVPAIQYAIADENHYTILGNVVFYIGLAIPTFFLWPLPLLHGRKPYTLAALAILMPLQFPQALVVGTFRSPNSPEYRVGLLLSRSFAGVAMGFANFNFMTTLLDLFGASLQSRNPHQEVVNENDVRRHGGGMGVWLGLWTWCSIGSLGVGFFIGAVIISGLNVDWGFWITIILTAAVLLLNVVTPEVRRSPYRRSLAEVPQDGGDVSRRIARGEIMMHLYQTGPLHWWEEVGAGLVLVKRMLSQPAFVVMAVYLAWIYGQIVMVIVLLGALTSRYYRFRPQYVGLCVLAIPIGALLAVPFQKGNVFSRSRHHPPRTDSMTFQKRFNLTSHLVRRIIFMAVLPFGGLAYTLSSGGPPTPFILPTIFAGSIGFLSNLAIAECYGIIMETFDTSDLQPGMTGRPRKVLSDEVRRKQTNFSSFPRVTAAFMICQTFSFIIAAAATGAGGRIERRLGAQASTGVVAGILLILTAALTVILIRVKTVQIVPVKRWGTAQLSGPGDDWKPVIVGHPSGINRRVSLLELGAMTRWVEIRRRNRLLDEQDRRAETFQSTVGTTTGRDTGFRPGPGPGPSGVRDFVRNGARGFENADS